MSSDLRTYYLLSLLPPVVCATAALAVRAGDLMPSIGAAQGHQIGAWLFLATVALAVAAPVMLRTHFAHRVRALRQTPPREFVRLQRRLIGLTLGAAYAVPVVCLVDLPPLYHAGVVLAALYGVYYQYPSARRIDFDRRIFRVADDADA